MPLPRSSSPASLTARPPFRRTHTLHPTSNLRFRRLAAFPSQGLKRSCKSPLRRSLRGFPTRPTVHASGRARALTRPHSLRSSLSPGLCPTATTPKEYASRITRTPPEWAWVDASGELDFTELVVHCSPGRIQSWSKYIHTYMSC